MPTRQLHAIVKLLQSGNLQYACTAMNFFEASLRKMKAALHTPSTLYKSVLLPHDTAGYIWGQCCDRRGAALVCVHACL
jgi:hypothetical protein